MTGFKTKKVTGPGVLGLMSSFRYLGDDSNNYSQSHALPGLHEKTLFVVYIFREPPLIQASTDRRMLRSMKVTVSVEIS